MERQAANSELETQTSSQPFKLCPNNHPVYTRLWNLRVIDGKTGMYCGKCDKVYTTEELSEHQEQRG